MDTTLVSRGPEIMSDALCFTGIRVPVQNLFRGTRKCLNDFRQDGKRCPLRVPLFWR